MGSYIFGVLAFLIVGYSASSVRIINQGNEGLVERLGRFKGKLRPGLNFIVPILDRVVLVETLREQITDIPPKKAITKDNVNIDVDAVVYWRILDLERTYYEIEDVVQGIEELAVTTLRSEIGKMDLQETFSSRDVINRALVEQLDEATEPWGVKIMRVEVQEITPPEEVIESMQLEQAAEIKRKAAVTEAEGEKQASIARAEGTVESMKQLAQAFELHGDSKAILRYLIASQYVEASQKLSASENSKVLFMNPEMLTEGLVDLINDTAPEASDDRPEPPKNTRPRRP